MRHVLFLVVLLICAGIRLVLAYAGEQPFRNNQQITISQTLFSEPQIMGSRQLISFLHARQRITAITSSILQYHYGQTLVVSGTLKERVTKNNRLELVIYNPTISVTQTSPMVIAGVVRQKLINLYRMSLPQTSASLLLGILFGIRDGMPLEFTNKLRAAGVTHVVAASGMNISLVSAFLIAIATQFLKRRSAIAVGILGIWIYVLLSGLSASLVRAAIMGTLALVASVVGRQTLALYLLAVTGAIMLFINPFLIEDIGFELSFLSCFSLMTLYPLFTRLVPSFEKIGLVGSDFLTTLSVQIFTIPLLIMHFETYSPVSILTNILLLWTIAPLMFLGGIASLVGFIFFPLGKILLYLCFPLLSYFEQVVNYLGSFSFSFGQLPWQWGVTYYLFLFSAMIFLQRSHE